MDFGATVTIERIFRALESGGALIETAHVRVLAGAGIEGDRYFDAKDEPGQNITLVEAEVIEAFNTQFGTRHELSCTRRNLVTRGVRLSSLVGREFSVGGVRLRGMELCEPCMGLGEAMASEGITPSAVVEYLVHRAGIRADVLSSGVIAAGAQLSVAVQTMAPTSDEVLASIRAAFPEGRWPSVMGALDTYGVEAHERERERVQRALLKLSEGSEAKLLEYVAVAKRDYRDVLFWAEYPAESKIDTSEKRQEVRELFEKLGVELPPGLMDEPAPEVSNGALAFSTTDDPPETSARVIDAGLELHNRTVAPLTDVKPLASFASSPSGRVVGGAVGRTWGRCCELLQLWVEPGHRASGVGSRLLRQFEEHARSRGCSVFYLTTLSFQAPDFYRKHGYVSMAEISGYPNGITKYLMHKTSA